MDTMITTETHDSPPNNTTPKTLRNRIYPYEEYYEGRMDAEDMREDGGTNMWTGGESREQYRGQWVLDTMNGEGEYRWRSCGPQGVDYTYEGSFYANDLHGYGIMSYPNGKIFTGLYHKNIRWGPGFELFTSTFARTSNVGFWRRNQLVRLAWSPDMFPPLDLMAAGSGWRRTVEPHRIILKTITKKIGDTNSAIDLLKQNGADPIQATRDWPKLYSKYCTDLESPACQIDEFDHGFYGGQIKSLVEMTNADMTAEMSEPEYNKYFAWNNSDIVVNMMQHCYKHEHQRSSIDVNLSWILNAQRKHFRFPGKHERNSRSLLMASYMGDINNVMQLVNKEDVYPNVTDARGNNAIMYATVTDQIYIINFLKEAGADVNHVNDSCCTPLGVLLMRYVCVKNDVAPNSMISSLLPPQATAENNFPPYLKNIFEWQISRGLSLGKHIEAEINLERRPSRQPRRSRDKGAPMTEEQVEEEEDSEDSSEEEYAHASNYTALEKEYTANLKSVMKGLRISKPYIFAVGGQDITQKSGKSTQLSVSGLKSGKRKESSAQDGQGDSNKADALKKETLPKIMLTMFELLEDGADPSLVKCPQPAIVMAVFAENADIVNSVIRYTSNLIVNERFSNIFNYSALDIAICRPPSFDNLAVIQALLENGADATHRLPSPGEEQPTLLHVVLNAQRQPECEEDVTRVEQIYVQTLELLVTYNCDPTALFEGSSAIDIAMCQSINILNAVTSNPITNMDCIINSEEQTVMVKYFSVPYFDFMTSMFPDRDITLILTTLLKNGADPLIECQYEENKYSNVLQFAKKNLALITPPKIKVDTKVSSKSLKKPKSSKGLKQNEDANRISPAVRLKYSYAVAILQDWIRPVHVRFVQLTLMKKLVKIIEKNRHRRWIAIIKEIKDTDAFRFWLTPQNCLDIWALLKTKPRKWTKGDNILEHLLCIVMYYSNHFGTTSVLAPLTYSDKVNIDEEVASMLHREKASKRDDDQEQSNILYKLFRKQYNFNICLECSVDLQNIDENVKIPCNFCRLVSYCSRACLMANIKRYDCHPCKDFLSLIYYDEGE